MLGHHVLTNFRVEVVPVYSAVVCPYFFTKCPLPPPDLQKEGGRKKV